MCPAANGATSLRSSLANFRSALAPAGIDQMLVDAEFVRAAELDSRTRWLFGGFLRAGIANLLLGRSGEAVATFREGLGLTTGNTELPHVKILCLAYLAFALAETGNEPAARKSAQEAWAISVGERLDRSLPGGVALTARAMALAHDGDIDRATLQLRDARRTSHLFRGARWINADMNIRWGNISLDLGDRPGAQEHAETARAALHGYPDPGMLPSRLAQLDERLAVPAELTPAEMRILPFLPTPPLGQGGRRAPRRVTRHREDARFLCLRQARCDVEIGCGREDAAPRSPPRPRRRAALTAARVEQRPHLESGPSLACSGLLHVGVLVGDRRRFEAELVHPRDRVRSRCGAELGVDGRDMRLHGRRRHVEAFGDLLDREVRREEGEDPDLRRGELEIGEAADPPVELRESPRQRARIRIPVQRGACGLCVLLRRGAVAEVEADRCPSGGSGRRSSQRAPKRWLTRRAFASSAAARSKSPSWSEHQRPCGCRDVAQQRAVESLRGRESHRRTRRSTCRRPLPVSARANAK